jgi:hypothetical protein
VLRFVSVFPTKPWSWHGTLRATRPGQYPCLMVIRRAWLSVHLSPHCSIYRPCIFTEALPSFSTAPVLREQLRW